MSAFQRSLLVMLGTALGLAAWMFRYEVVPIARGSDGSFAAGYVLDRWTGSVDLLWARSRHPVTPKQDGEQ